MVAPSAGQVVLVPFPFSDLSQSKVRPAVCLADAGGGDWVLCQVTSNAYGDPLAEAIASTEFASGGLRVESFARPGKLFTAHAGLLTGVAGTLTRTAFDRVVAAVVRLLQPNP